MNLADINRVLAAAALPCLDRGQVQALVDAGAFQQFAQDLALFSDLPGQKLALELVVRSLSPSVRSTLESVGLEAPLNILLPIARREQLMLFKALHALRLNSSQKNESVIYLRSLGLPALPWQAAQSSRATTPAPPPYFSFKVFGKSAALCFAEGTTRQDGQHTINIEGAIALGSNGQRTYDWKNKIILQLMPGELYQLLAFFEGSAQDVKFEGHGVKHDKALHLERQANKSFLARLFQKGRGVVLVPISAHDAARILSLTYKQVLTNEPHQTLDAIRSTLAHLA
ncbi:hypothetical protein [Pseudoduganella sp. R-34]|jgi:hypothetical protein|uniref:hypothetical protein n=1 Tax=Pseudoduganella sp. R-34 TaxID=3404062 RepID=UPI003CFAE15D